MCNDDVAPLDRRMDFQIGQHLVVLRAMDARCMVRTGKMLSKEQPVTLPHGEVLIVKFVAQRVRSPFVWFRPHRYDALELEWVDAETRGSADYRGYALMLEKTVVNECCRSLS
jgi:hypothetical protein